MLNKEEKIQYIMGISLCDIISETIIPLEDFLQAEKTFSNAKKKLISLINDGIIV